MAENHTPPEVIIKKLEITWQLTNRRLAGLVSNNDLQTTFRQMYDTVTKAVDANDYGKTASEESGE